MKKIALLSIMLLALIFMESFSPQSAGTEAQKGRVGVWKTYEDYANGHLTDLGEEMQKHNDEGRLIFDKEVVTPKETKYWGARIHDATLETKGFTGSYKMETGSSTPVRFIKESEYLFLVNPMPIGVYMPRYSLVGIVYDDNGDVDHIYSPAFNTKGRTNYLDLHSMLLYVAKGDGEVIRTSEKDCRKLFEDDPEILKDYDSDNTFTNVNTKRTLRVLKYVVRYNKKHTPGYKPDVMN